MAGEIRLAIAGSCLKYAVETTAGVRPTSGYTLVPEVTNIPQLASTDYDKIDMTPVNETVQHIEVTGLRQAPGTLTFEANLSDTLLTFWDNTLVPAYQTAIANNKHMWFVVEINGMDNAYYFTAEPKVLSPSGGAAADGWKCTLPITMTNTPQWYAKPGSANTLLTGLTVGTNALTPAFSSNVYNYSVTTANDSDVITAAPADSTATVAIASTDATISTNTATWGSGTNVVTVTVSKSGVSTVYTLNVSKST